MSWLGNDADLGKSHPEDVAWLSSLSHSELDMLINIKKLVIQRAKVVGFEDLGDKFDVKLLRATGVVLLEYLKERLGKTSVSSNSAGISASIDRWSLATLKHGDGCNAVADQDTDSITTTCHRKKRTRESLGEEEVRDFKKQKAVGPRSMPQQ